jgi:hypothetical protein
VLRAIGAKLGKSPVAPVVAGLVDQRLRFREIALGKMVVGKIEPLAVPRSDPENFVQIARSAAGEECQRKIVESRSEAKVIDGLVELVNKIRRSRRDRHGQAKPGRGRCIGAGRFPGQPEAPREPDEGPLQPDLERYVRNRRG